MGGTGAARRAGRGTAVVPDHQRVQARPRLDLEQLLPLQRPAREESRLRDGGNHVGRGGEGLEVDAGRADDQPLPCQVRPSAEAEPYRLFSPASRGSTEARDPRAGQGFAVPRVGRSRRLGERDLQRGGRARVRRRSDGERRRRRQWQEGQCRRRRRRLNFRPPRSPWHSLFPLPPRPHQQHQQQQHRHQYSNQRRSNSRSRRSQSRLQPRRPPLPCPIPPRPPCRHRL